MSPDLAVPAWRTIIVALMVVAVFVIFAYASAVGTIVLGLLIILGAGALLYYIGVRLDQWAKHGGKRREWRRSE